MSCVQNAVLGAAAALMIMGSGGIARAQDNHIVEIRPIISEVRELVRDVRDLKGGAKNVEGAGRALISEVSDLNKALRDLGAKETKKEIRVALSADVLFDFDKANIKPEAASALDTLLVIIREKRKGFVRIDGHTDAKGSDRYNMRLSERRASSVKGWLAKKGQLSPRLFVTRGRGEQYPAAPNTTTDGSDNPEGRAKNRRVEIVIETVKR